MSASSSIDVILVEPSHMQQRIIGDELQKLGVTDVRAVASGAEALAAMRADAPALVLSAMSLPDMSGTDLVLAMRADERLTGIAFILVSSETRPQVLDGIRQSGACAILPKPFTHAQLDRAMCATIEFLDPSERLDLDAEVELEALRVMIVDDSGNSRRFIRRVLENLGIENFLEASNGRQAMALLGENLVDLVITDYNMPEMDGLEALSRIMQKCPTPVVMLSNQTRIGAEATVKALELGAFAVKSHEMSDVRMG